MADYLRGEIHKGKSVIRVNAPFACLWTFVANEGRTPEQGAKFKRLGVRRGNPDLLFWWTGNYAAIELKKHDGKQSPYQRDWMDYFHSIGGKYAICRTVAEVRDQLIAWGLECKNTHAIEPAATFAEKVEWHHLMNRPL